MAKKGQKFKSFSDELRKEIVGKYLNNEATPTMLAREYKVSLKTIWNWISKYRTGYNLESKNHLKGRKKEENIDYKERYEILKNYQTFLKAQRERK